MASPAIARRSLSWVPRVTRVLDLAVRSYWQTFNLRDPVYRKTVERLFGGGVETYAGIQVNERNALTFSAVFDAVNQISSDVAKLPLVLRKRRSTGGSDPYDDSPLYWLLKTEPNPEMGSMVFRRTLTAHALMYHGGYAEIERDGLGRPLNLWVITPDRIEPDRERIRRADGTETYGPLRYKLDGGKRYLQPADVLHLQGLGYDGTAGYAVIHAARQTIGLALSAQRFDGNFLGSGSMFGGVIGMDHDLDLEQQEDIRQQIEKIHQHGDRAAWRFLVLGAGAKYMPFGTKPNESQLNQLSDRQVIEVARFFNMPPHKLKALDRATFSNIESQDLDYYKSCLLTWITLWEEELNRKLVPRLERRQQFVKHNVNAFLRGDIQSRFTALGIARDKGVISADEWRELEDMNPQDGGQGRLYLVQSAQVPLGQLAELTQSQIAKNQAKTPAPAPAPGANGPTRDQFETVIAEIRDAAQRADALARSATETAREEAARRAAAEQAGTLSEAARQASEAREAEAQSRAREFERLAVDRQRELALAEQAREQAQREATAADRLRQEADTRLAALRDQVAAAEARAEAAQARADEAAAIQADLQRTVARLETAGARAAEDREAAAAAWGDARDDAAQARAAEQAARAEVRALADQLRTHEIAAAEGAERLSALDVELAAARDRTRQAEQAAHDAERDRRESAGALIRAHHAVVVSTMRRLLERETDRIRSKAGFAEKLEAFLDPFYTRHEALLADALLELARVHVAYCRSPASPEDLAAALARAHVEQSLREVRTILEGDAEDLAVSMGALMTRWEDRRPTQIADAWMEQELDHVGR